MNNENTKLTKNKRINFQKAEILYSSKKEVNRKWIKEYKRVSNSNTLNDNKDIFVEVFKLFEAVAGFRMNEFIQRCSRLEKEGNGTDMLPDFKEKHYWLFKNKSDTFIAYSNGKEYRLSDITPTASFFNKFKNLCTIGYDLPDKINSSLRIIRNNASHTTETVFAGNIIREDDLIQWLDIFADGLIELGMLDSSLRRPNAEIMKVSKGDYLQGNKFRVVKFIARGGSCRVYEGMQDSLQRKVAIKEYIPDLFGNEKIAFNLVERECNALRDLRHPRIPTVYDTFSENGTYYVVMDFINGVSLNKIDHSKLGFQKAIDIVKELCEVTEYLNSKNVNHCDIKPENIMIDTNGHIFLIDFGISNLNVNKTMVSAGSPGFTAPEIFDGRPSTKRSDIYSIGKIMLYLMDIPDVHSSVTRQNEAFIKIADKASSLLPENRYADPAGIKNELALVVKLKDRKKLSPAAKIGMSVGAILLCIVIAVTAVIMNSDSMVYLDSTINHGKSYNVELYKTTQRGYDFHDRDIYFNLAVKNNSSEYINNVQLLIKLQQDDSTADYISVNYNISVAPGETASSLFKLSEDQYNVNIDKLTGLTINIVSINDK